MTRSIDDSLPVRVSAAAILQTSEMEESHSIKDCSFRTISKNAVDSKANNHVNDIIVSHENVRLSWKIPISSPASSKQICNIFDRSLASIESPIISQNSSILSDEPKNVVPIESQSEHDCAAVDDVTSTSHIDSIEVAVTPISPSILSGLANVESNNHSISLNVVEVNDDEINQTNRNERCSTSSSDKSQCETTSKRRRSSRHTNVSSKEYTNRIPYPLCCLP
jgi:hypothetical protein